METVARPDEDAFLGIERALTHFGRDLILATVMPNDTGTSFEADSRRCLAAAYSWLWAARAEPETVEPPMQVDRIPEDLARHAQLFGNLSHLWTKLREAGIPIHLEVEDPESGFTIGSVPGTGEIYCANLHFAFDDPSRAGIDFYCHDDLSRRYPLTYFYGCHFYGCRMPGDREGGVFDEDGSFTPGFLAIVAPDPASSPKSGAP